jgi:hypothetical protein
MAFADSLAALLSERGIPIDPEAIPDRETTNDGLSTTRNWLEELDPAIREGFDESSEEFAICHIVAGDDVAVAPELAGLFQAFDQVAGQRFSALLATTQEAVDQAED